MAVLKQKNGTRLRRFIKPKYMNPSKFEVYVHAQRISPLEIEFTTYAKYKSFQIFELRAKEFIYGDLSVHGKCTWEDYHTVVDYNFWHADTQPLTYKLIPRLVYAYYRRVPYAIIILLTLIFDVSLTFGFYTWAGYSDQVETWRGLTGLVFIATFAISALITTNLYEKVYPAILLDNFMRKTFNAGQIRKKRG